MSKYYEINFDGLIGPTHNFSGLSVGNVASINSKESISFPKEAALQGLKKMKDLHDLGFKQGVIPPHQRPDLNTLKRLGFNGSPKEIIAKAVKQDFNLLKLCYSASSMWTANMGTMTPSCDSLDHLVHFTPANLNNKFHRCIEPEQSSNIFKKIFSNPTYFIHHSHLPQHSILGDEGAANHTRFSSQNDYSNSGIHLFVYGTQRSDPKNLHKIFEPRQTLEASQAIARLHNLPKEKTIFLQQNPMVIDQGVFHNDVIAVGNQNVYFYHQDAYLNNDGLHGELSEKFKKINGDALTFIEVTRDQIPLSDAIRSYLFNSQLLTNLDGETILIAPTDCQEIQSVKKYLDDHIGKQDFPISKVLYFDVRQSMKNGGGPACLRNRIILNQNELESLKANVLLNNQLYGQLQSWINKFYREQLSQDDLKDPSLYFEVQDALTQLNKILKL